MKKNFIPLLLIIPAFLMTGCGMSLAGDIKPPADYTPPAVLPPAATAVVYPLLPPDPTRGEGIYAEHCSSCHGDLGNGAGSKAGDSTIPPSALAHPDILRNAVPQDWFEEITHGNEDGSMPGFTAKLDERSRWDVISYLLSLENSMEQMEMGLDIYYTICSDCHGEDGRGDGVRAETLQVKPANFNDHRLMSAISNQDMINVLDAGLGQDMPAFGNMLGENEKLAVIGYIRSLAYKPVQLPEETQTPTPESTAESDPVKSEPSTTLEDGGGEEISTDPRLVTVRGEVINDSGNSTPTDLQVTLHIFNQMEQVSSMEASVRSDGTYEFTGIEMSTGRIFIASVDYAGQQFSSLPSMHPGAPVDETLTVIDLPVHIYESTTDTSVVSAEKMHIFFDFSNPGIVQVVELFLISNSSNKVLVAEESGQGILEFPLPAGAVNLQFQDSILGDRYLPTDSGFTDTIPVKPGESVHQVLFAFDYPYTKKAQLNLPIPIEVKTVSAMFPVDGIKVKSDQLIDGGVKRNQGMNFRLFTGSNFEPGSTLELTLSGKVADQESNSEKKVDYLLLGAGVFLFTLSAAGFFIYRNQKPVDAVSLAETTTSPDDKESLMDAIIALDNSYKEGKLQEDTYQTRRNELKNRLRDLM